MKRPLKVDRRLPTPCYSQVAQGIQRQIESGELNAGTRLPNEQQLAARFGVHWLTVHRALQELAKGGWLDRRPRHGTRVAAFARDCVIIIPDPGDMESESEFSELLGRSLLTQLSQGRIRGHILHSPKGAGYVENHPVLSQMLKTRHTYGVIFAGLCPGPNLQRNLIQLGVPYVHIHAAEGVKNSIWVDYMRMHQMAVDFLQKRPCRRVGVIVGSPDDRARFQSILDGKESLATDFKIGVIDHGGRDIMSKGFIEGEQFLQANPGLDGLFINDDILARGVCMALLKLRRRVPERITLVHHFNTGSQFSYPFASAKIETDPLKIIHAALQRIEKMRNGINNLPERELIQPQLIHPNA